MLNSEQKVEECDATKLICVNVVDNTSIQFPFLKNFIYIKMFLCSRSLRRGGGQRVNTTDTPVYS